MTNPEVNEISHNRSLIEGSISYQVSITEEHKSKELGDLKFNSFRHLDKLIS